MRASRTNVLLVVMIGLGTLGLQACASSGTSPRPRPFPSPDWNKPPSRPEGAPAGTPPAEGAPSAPLAPPAPLAPDLLSRRFEGRAVAEFALGFRGVPYRLGGSDPGGFDCSGLVQYVFAQYGVAVPRVVEEQYEVGEKVKDKDVKPGDLLFFKTNGHEASHVAIAIGEERFVHAPNSAGVVRVEALTSAYWGSRYVGARRLAAPASTN